MEEEKKKSWMDDLMIEVPLKKFIKMKTKILKYEQDIADRRHNYYELQSRYDRLKEDYQKILGVTSEEGKQE